ncbi:prepilin-type N-terminal cleavage/methylation domain-containing protein [Synechococcus sp. CCY9201]|nr:prepilin-type N-terminal cleavage/methylation domain-containing protein [Synechococcus sp. CCY9201]
MNRTAGYTLVELMVTIAVLGILGAVVINSGIDAWRAEQAKAAVTDLSSWLEEIRSSGASQDISCRVTINTGSSLASQSVLATVQAIDPETNSAATGVTCGTGNPLRLPGIGGNATFGVATSFASTSPPNTFSFTPRGAISTDNVGSTLASSFLSIRISLGGQVPLRCVRLSGMLGLVRLGSNNSTGSTSSECTTWGQV